VGLQQLLQRHELVRDFIQVLNPKPIPARTNHSYGGDGLDVKIEVEGDIDSYMEEADTEMIKIPMMMVMIVSCKHDEVGEEPAKNRDDNSAWQNSYRLLLCVIRFWSLYPLCPYVRMKYNFFKKVLGLFSTNR
jgi:hypothetical protein